VVWPIPGQTIRFHSGKLRTQADSRFSVRLVAAGQSDYKHVVLGLIILKHISNAFEATASIYRVASP
jgi:type I restriction-modification system DNA methylase subunit